VETGELHWRTLPSDLHRLSQPADLFSGNNLTTQVFLFYFQIGSVLSPTRGTVCLLSLPTPSLQPTQSQVVIGFMLV
jgi:hypothetical protein